MKKAIIIIAGLAAFVSCSKEKNETPAVKTDKVFYVEATASAQADGQGTKVVYIDGEGIKWQTTETIFLTNATCTVTKQSAPSTTEGYTGTFGFTELAAGDYYPYHNMTVEADGDDRKYTAIVPASQTQTTAGTLNAGTIPLVGDDKITYDGTNPVETAKFDVVGTLVRFLVFGGASDETVSATSINSGGEWIAGKLYAKEGGTNTWYSRETSGTITVSLTTPAAASDTDKEDANGIYVHMLPTKTTYTYKVTTNKTDYTFVSAKEKDYQNGKIYDMPLNLRKATAVKVGSYSWYKKEAPEVKSYDDFASISVSGYHTPSWNALNALVGAQSYFGQYDGKNGLLITHAAIDGLSQGTNYDTVFTDEQIGLGLFLPVNNDDWTGRYWTVKSDETHYQYLQFNPSWDPKIKIDWNTWAPDTAGVLLVKD